MRGAFTVKLYNPASAVRCDASKFDEQLFHVRCTRVLYVHGMCLTIYFKVHSLFLVCAVVMTLVLKNVLDLILILRVFTF